MKLNAVGVISKNTKQSLEFYKVLGFEFPQTDDSETHIESIPKDGSIRLMIDSEDIVREIIGTDPFPSNHSTFAIQYDSPEEVDSIVTKILAEGFTVVRQPWDAFWGQRYAIVQDPGGYMVDLYASL